MERIMRKQQLCEQVACLHTSFEETGEAIVADDLPDLSDVVYAQAQVMIRDKSVQDGCVLISGTIRMCALCIPEEGGVEQSMEIPITFSQKIRMEDARGGMLAMCSADVRDVEAKLLTPRKLGVHTVVQLCICLYREYEDSVITEIGGNEGIQTLPELLDACELRFACSKNFTVIEDVDLTQENIGELLCAQAAIESAEAAISQGHINCRGVIRLSILYLTSRDTIWISQSELPFTQSLEQPGLEDDMEVSVRCTLRSMELVPAEEAEGDVLTATLGVCADFLVTARAQYPIIRDAYSTTAELLWEPVTHRYLPWQACGEVSVEVHETIPAESVSRVLAASLVQTDAAYMEEGQRLLPLRANILLTREDGSLYGLRPSFTVAIAGDAPGWYHVGSCTVTPDSKGLRLTAKLIAEPETPDFLTVDTVGELSQGEPYESRENPELVLCFDTSEGLWPIAKRCRVTQDAIREANGLAEEQAPGRVLLIPRMN